MNKEEQKVLDDANAKITELEKEVASLLDDDSAKIIAGLEEEISSKDAIIESLEKEGEDAPVSKVYPHAKVGGPKGRKPKEGMKYVSSTCGKGLVEVKL